MSAARINLKNIDYFKFKKLVIDANRDDYNACSKEVKILCDSVQLLNFRDEEFDDESDRGRFLEVISLYREILASKRIDALDMRIKSGWWGDHKNAYSAGKIKPQALKDMLVSKAKEWTHRHTELADHSKNWSSKIDGPGLFVFKHKDHQCFQFIGRAEKIFSKCGEKLKAAFEGNLQEPLAALLVISMSSDWDFYFLPVSGEDDEKVLRILENDLILKHDCIWPHGLNFCLHVDSLLEVSEFRKSCIRHNWPPDGDALDSLEIDMVKLRKQVESSPSIEAPVVELPVSQVKTKKAVPKKENDRPAWDEDFRLDRKAKEKAKEDQKATSPTSENAEMTTSSTSSSSDTPKESLPTVSTPKRSAQTRSITAVKKVARKTPTSPRREINKAKPIAKSDTTNKDVDSKVADKDNQIDSATRTVTPALDAKDEVKQKKITALPSAKSQSKSPQPPKKKKVPTATLR